MAQIVWSNYLRYRAELRGFKLAKIEEILRFSGERYYDTVTGREIAVGKHDNRLVIIPYEPEVGSFEISPNITAELNEAGELIGVEIIQASSFIRDTILESAQAKLLNLVSSKVTST